MPGEGQTKVSEKGPLKGSAGGPCPFYRAWPPQEPWKEPMIFLFGVGGLRSGWHGRRKTSWCGGGFPRLRRLGPQLVLVPTPFSPLAGTQPLPCFPKLPAGRGSLLPCPLGAPVGRGRRRVGPATVAAAPASASTACGPGGVGGGEQGSFPHPRTPNVLLEGTQREACRKISPSAGYEVNSPAPGTGSRSFQLSGFGVSGPQ